MDGLAAERDLAVFCDTSAFEDDAPAKLWEALLCEPGRLVLTERVRAELLPWLGRRPDHPISVALRERHDAIVEQPEPQPGEPGRRAFDYYMALLSVRRRATELARSEFQREHGRDPAPDEERRSSTGCSAGLASEVGSATKPVGNYTDEALSISPLSTH